MSALRATSSGGSATANASASITKPTGAAVGDTVIFAVIAAHHSGTNAAISGTVTGWTDTGDVAGGNADFHFRGFARVLDGTESWPLSVATTSTVHAWVCGDYSGASGWDSTSMPAPAYSSTGTTTAGNSVTLASSGDWIDQFVMLGRDAASTAAVLTTPASGFTKQADSTGFLVASSAYARAYLTDLQSAQASGTYTPGATTVTSGVPRFVWDIGILLGTSGSATLTTGDMEFDAPLLTPQATAQDIPLTTDGMTFAAPLLTPEPTAQVVSLTTPHITLAAPLVQISKGVGLTTPNMAFAAPAVSPRATAQTIPLTTPGMTFHAPAVQLGVSTTLTLTTCLMTLQSFPINPAALIPVYINPWYENQLDPLSSDFQGPSVP